MKDALALSLRQAILETSQTLDDALDSACLALARESRLVSAGYVRKDVSAAKWQPKTPHNPVDGGDAWVKTGAENV
jgi:hypothetical protein